jgi:protein O-GlcNAc transferase
VSGRISKIYAAQWDDAITGAREETLAQIGRLEEEIRQHPTKPSLYDSVARLYLELSDRPAAEAALRTGIAACPPASRLYWRLIKILEESGRTEEAIALAAMAIERADEGLQFRWAELLSLPLLYDTEEEVNAYRERFARGLNALAEEIAEANPEALRALREGLNHFTNFYLPYQGHDDVELQKQYGSLVHRILQTQYPQWSSAPAMPAQTADGRVRVGFASRFFHDHTVSRLFAGWLEKCDRKRFEIHAYYSGRPDDDMTRRVREASDSFCHTPDDFEGMCSRIRQDELQVLVFMDIGMAPEMTLLAGLRLAPVQCVAWGHPVTSGLPTVDYFLSSELMEPEGAQQSYSERLVLLPGIGACVDKPWIPRAILNKTRADWGISENAVVYLCCQSLFKYLPRYDYILAAIAERVVKARFIFLGRGELPSERFQARLERVFSRSGLHAGEYCLILPLQRTMDYWNLHLVSDIFLDSLGWSGGISSLEAMACELPMVTLPGRFLRGRHTYAILTQLGVTETIASSESDYIKIAARLGLDPAARKALVRKMAENAGRLYGDLRSVRAVEEFLWAAARP